MWKIVLVGKLKGKDLGLTSLDYFVDLARPSHWKSVAMVSICIDSIELGSGFIDGCRIFWVWGFVSALA